MLLVWQYGHYVEEITASQVIKIYSDKYVNEKWATDAQGILTSQQLIQLITALPYLYANINHAVIVPAKTSSKNMK